MQRALSVAALIGAASAPARAAQPAVMWVPWTASPVPIVDSPPGEVERAVQHRCGDGDAGLQATAAWVVAQKVSGGPMPDLDAVAFVQRSAGEPHPWARVWSASARTLAVPGALAKLETWLRGGAAVEPDASVRRCGVATGRGRDGGQIVAVVAVEALADLAPLATRGRTGQWLTVEARLRVRARGGTVIVLGPTGPPRSVPTSFDGSTLRARFPLAEPGEFAVQVTADLGTGPRPVLEASVFADVEPPATPNERRAPGEEIGARDQDGTSPAMTARRRGQDEDALANMVDAARDWAGLSPLARDPVLDEVAHEHARRMASTGQLAHDVGTGDPLERLRAAGVDVRDVGENVAHSASVALSHRAMWTSPSHRANMLRRDFDRIGVGVVRDAQGQVWAVEEFSSDVW